MKSVQLTVVLALTLGVFNLAYAGKVQQKAPTQKADVAQKDTVSQKGFLARGSRRSNREARGPLRIFRIFKRSCV